MNENIESIAQACKELGYEYELNHESKNLLSVVIGGERYPFINWTTPLNPQSIVRLCQDKGYFYSYFSNKIRMPNTLSFLNPYCDEKYLEYVQQPTIHEIISQAEKELNYPMIVKKNRGSSGINVFKTSNRRELEKGIIDIYNINGADFDYACIVQEFIHIKTEYRVVYLNGKLIFGYEKIIDNAECVGNVSPLHWEGSKAKLVTDSEVNDELRKFCAPLFDKLNIPFCGLDVALDYEGSYCLIEANTAPGFYHFIKHNGNRVVCDMYKAMLKDLIQQ